MGLDPKIPDAEGRPAPAVELINGQPYLTLTFRRLLLSYEVDYFLEISDDLLHWRQTAQPVGSPRMTPDGFQTVTFRDESAIGSGTARFMRLRIARTSR